MRTKKVKLFALVVACLLAVCAVIVAACDFTFRSKELEKITLDTSNAKTTFYVDEGLYWTSEGLQVTAFYDDGSTAVIESGYYVREASLSAVGEEQVRVIYGTAEAYYTVTVAQVDHLRLDTSAVDKTFRQGDEFNSEGLKVYAVYTNGDEVLLSGGYEVSADLDTVGATQAVVTYSAEVFNEMGGGTYYKTFKASYTVSVLAQNLKGIVIEKAPEKDHYYVGDALETEGLVVYGVFEGQGNLPLGDVEFTFTAPGLTDGKFTQDGTITVTVHYDEYTATFDVTVEKVVPVSLALDTSKVQKEFFVGDAFSYEGLVVTADYNNGKRATVTPTKVEGSTAVAGDAITVTVFYTEGDVTVTETYTIKVTAVVLEEIEIKSKPEKLTYYVGDDFSAEGLVITAKYNNGKTKELSLGTAGLTVSTPDMGTTGTKPVTVTYTENGANATATFEITVRVAELTKIEITSAPTTTEYYVGDTLRTEGLVVTATYENNTTKDVTDEVTLTAEGFMAADGKLTKAGEQIAVTVSYGAVEAKSFAVKVYNKLTGIEVTVKGTGYVVGDTFEGVTVTAYYNGGELSNEVEADYNITPALYNGKFVEAGEHTVAVSYSEELIAGRRLTEEDDVTFEVANSYTFAVEYNPEEGTVSYEAKDYYKAGESVTFTVEATEGYEVESVIANGVTLTASEGNAYTVTFVDANITVTVTFAKVVEVIEIEITGTQNHPASDFMQFTHSTSSEVVEYLRANTKSMKLKVNDGEEITVGFYEILAGIMNIQVGAGNKDKSKYEFFFRAEDGTLIAHALFEQVVVYTVTVDVTNEDGGSYELTNEHGEDVKGTPVEPGTMLTLKVKANSGYMATVLVGSDDVTEQAVASGYEFSVDSNITVTITFNREGEEIESVELTLTYVGLDGDVFMIFNYTASETVDLSRVTRVTVNGDQLNNSWGTNNSGVLIDGANRFIIYVGDVNKTRYEFKFFVGNLEIAHAVFEQQVQVEPKITEAYNATFIDGRLRIFVKGTGLDAATVIELLVNGTDKYSAKEFNFGSDYSELLFELPELGVGEYTLQLVIGETAYNVRNVVDTTRYEANGLTYEISIEEGVLTLAVTGEIPPVSGYEITKGSKNDTFTNAGKWYYNDDGDINYTASGHVEDGVATFEITEADNSTSKNIYLQYQPNLEEGTPYIISITVNVSAPVRLTVGTTTSNARYVSFGGANPNDGNKQDTNKDYTITWPNPTGGILGKVDKDNPFRVRFSYITEGAVTVTVKNVVVEENAYFLSKKSNSDVVSASGVGIWAYNESAGESGTYTLASQPKFNDGTVTISYKTMGYTLKDGKNEVGAMLRYQPDLTVGKEYTVSYKVAFEQAGRLVYRINKTNDYKAINDIAAGQTVTVSYDDVVHESQPIQIDVRAAEPNSPFTATVTEFTITEKQQGTINNVYNLELSGNNFFFWTSVEGFDKTALQAARLVVDGTVNPDIVPTVNPNPNESDKFQFMFDLSSLEGSATGMQHTLWLDISGEVFEIKGSIAIASSETADKKYEINTDGEHLVLTVTTVGDEDTKNIQYGGEADAKDDWRYWNDSVSVSEVKLIDMNNGVNIHAVFEATGNLDWGFQIFYNDTTTYPLNKEYILKLTIKTLYDCTVTINGQRNELTANESKTIEVKFTYDYHEPDASWNCGTSLFDMQVIAIQGKQYDLTLTDIRWEEVEKAPLVPTTPMDPPEYLGDELTVGENATLANDKWHDRGDAKNNADNWNIWWVGEDGWNGCGTKLTSINSSLQGGALTVEYSGGSVGFSVQLYFNNSALVEGNDYFLTFKVKASAPCVIGIHGQSYVLGEGENTVTVVFTHTAELCAFDVQLPGCNSFDHLNEAVESLKFEVSEVSWQEVLEKTEFIETAAKLEVDVDAGKVYFVLSGTYTGYTESALRTVLEEVFFSFKQNCTGIDGSWAEYEDLVREVYVDGNSWKIKFDVTALEYFGGVNLYTAYFTSPSGNQYNKGRDLKLDADSAEDGQCVVLNGKKYTLVNKFGDNENANVSWGCIALQVSQKSSVSFGEVTLDSSRDTSKVYLVLPVTAENYLAEDWKTAAIYGDAGNPISVSFVEAAEGQDNTWNLYFDVTDFRGELYLHLSVRGAKYNNTDDNVTRQSNPYVERKTDGFIYKVWFNAIWGEWGMPVLEVVETALKEPVKVGLETNEENTKVYYVVYVRLDSTDIISSISFGDIDNENSDKGKQMFNVEKYELVDGSLYKLYFDVTDVNVNEWVWPHLYFDRVAWDDDKGDINVAGSGSVTVNGRVYEIQTESGMPTLKNWNV